ncbi:MAG: hypothetical protein JWR69_4680, partial [Pedosphaera sp.]|nr:hypothetical protein [Pedosphaera sp.]
MTDIGNVQMPAIAFTSSTLRVLPTDEGSPFFRLRNSELINRACERA